MFLPYQSHFKILNASYPEQRVPIDWKMANITPLPKTKIVKDPKKDLRPIYC